jgi:Zn-dependent protease with chaperone function
MRYYVLLALVSCAAFAAASIVAAALSSITWRRLRSRLEEKTATRRARAIAAARLAPSAAGIAFATIVSAAFIRFEPLDTTETPGLFLLCAASLTFALVAVGLARGTQAIRAAARCRRLLRLGSRKIVHDGTRVWLLDTHYPVAAVTGLFRPRLLLSTRILEECTPSELDAILRHERAHVRRGDNLARAAILYLPNPLAFTSAGREMQRAWAAAAEEAADDAAAGDLAEGRTVLASALVRVARMASAPAPDWMPALTFYEGANLENRVRRLLDGAHLQGRVPVAGAALSLLSMAGCALTLTEAAARQLHSWMELAVQYVP